MTNPRILHFRLCEPIVPSYRPSSWGLGVCVLIARERELQWGGKEAGDFRERGLVAFSHYSCTKLWVPLCSTFIVYVLIRTANPDTTWAPKLYSPETSHCLALLPPFSRNFLGMLTHGCHWGWLVPGALLVIGHFLTTMSKPPTSSGKPSYPCAQLDSYDPACLTKTAFEL